MSKLELVAVSRDINFRGLATFGKMFGFCVILSALHVHFTCLYRKGLPEACL